MTRPKAAGRTDLVPWLRMAAADSRYQPPDVSLRRMALILSRSGAAILHDSIRMSVSCRERQSLPSAADAPTLSASKLIANSHELPCECTDEWLLVNSSRATAAPSSVRCREVDRAAHGRFCEDCRPLPGLAGCLAGCPPADSALTDCLCACSRARSPRHCDATSRGQEQSAAVCSRHSYIFPPTILEHLTDML